MEDGTARLIFEGACYKSFSGVTPGTVYFDRERIVNGEIRRGFLPVHRFSLQANLATAMMALQLLWVLTKVPETKSVLMEELEKKLVKD